MGYCFKKLFTNYKTKLFRTCKRLSNNGKIASFTGRFECARKISKCEGSLLICDTKEYLNFEEKFYKVGNYKHTFYPLVTVLKKAKDSGGLGFPEYIFDYIGEDEYIMRINLGYMYGFRWVRSDI